MDYTIKFKTTSNGHFGGSVSVNEEVFNKCINELQNSIKTTSGFNKYILNKKFLDVGYNHYTSIKKYFR